MKRDVWLLRTGLGIAPVNKLVSLTWLLWALRSFRSFTLNYITRAMGSVSRQQASTDISSTTFRLQTFRLQDNSSTGHFVYRQLLYTTFGIRMTRLHSINVVKSNYTTLYFYWKEDSD